MILSFFIGALFPIVLAHSSPNSCKNIFQNKLEVRDVRLKGDKIKISFQLEVETTESQGFAQGFHQGSAEQRFENLKVNPDNPHQSLSSFQQGQKAQAEASSRFEHDLQITDISLIQGGKINSSFELEIKAPGSKGFEILANSSQNPDRAQQSPTPIPAKLKAQPLRASRQQIQGTETRPSSQKRFGILDSIKWKWKQRALSRQKAELRESPHPPEKPFIKLGEIFSDTRINKIPSYKKNSEPKKD